MLRLATLTLIAALIAPLALFGCATTDGTATTSPAVDDDDDAAEQETEIAVAEVPSFIRDAAIAAVPGVTLLEAEREVAADGSVTYTLAGPRDGVRHEIEVAADGTVIEVETDDEDGDDDDDDDAG